MARSAEYKYDQHFSEEAYRLSRHAYTLDPFDPRGLLVYIASMVDLNLKTELFYLSKPLNCKITHLVSKLSRFPKLIAQNMEAVLSKKQIIFFIAFSDNSS